MTAAGDRPLPDELPAAALWWRLHQHLAPSVLDAAAASTAPQTLRPDWTPVLSAVLGDTVALRVLADPAWPGLVTAITHATHAGWEPAQILGTAQELLLAALDEDSVLRPAEVAPALVFRVHALLDHGGDRSARPPTDEAAASQLEHAPLDPEDEEAAAARAGHAAPSSAEEDSDTASAGIPTEPDTDNDYLAAVAAAEPAGYPRRPGIPQRWAATGTGHCWSSCPTPAWTRLSRSRPSPPTWSPPASNCARPAASCSTGRHRT